MPIAFHAPAIPARPTTADGPDVVLPVRSVPAEFAAAQHRTLWPRAAALAPGCPLVAVTSADGGAGRSTMVAALGSVLALACAGPVLAVDLAGAPWSGLEHRVRRRNDATLWDLAAAPDWSAARAISCAQLAPTGLHVLLGETRVTGARRPLQLAEAWDVTCRLRDFFTLGLLDLPPAGTDAVWRLLPQMAVPLLLARSTVDSLRRVMRLLAVLRAVGLGTTVERSVVVVMTASQPAGRGVRAALGQLDGQVGCVVAVPFDGGLARPDPVDARSLRRATRTVLVDLADAVIARCPVEPGPTAGAGAGVVVSS
jgi:MinD-like ATPase involved in chromosome partitioning or flagellar assembly